jgi:hypothetical protein
MSDSPVHSTRFTRAARAESERLLRQQQRADEEVKKKEDELAAARARLDVIRARLETLQGFTDERPELRPAPAPERGNKSVSGAEIRRVAIDLLRKTGHPPAPIHYRQWLEIVENAGYRVEGKRPDAVFLGQLGRSPVVKATTRAGWYELDEEAPRRIADEIEALEKQMGELAMDASEPPDRLIGQMERRQDLSASIRKAQRELKEAVALLGPPAQRMAA